MERNQYEALVREMEGLAARDPEGYAKKVDRWATGGIFAYCALVIGALACVLFLVGFQLVTGRVIAWFVFIALGLLVAVYGMVSILFTKPDPPEGLEVTKNDAPELHARLERLTQATQSPKIDTVLLSNDFNAAAFTHRRGFGVMLGLPLLATLGPEEGDAVIAHELAHHAKGDTVSGMRHYRLRMRWALVQHTAQASSAITFLASRFLAWYVPRFEAISEVTCRNAEFAADQVAAEATSSRASAMALARIKVVAISKYGPFFRQWMLSQDVHGDLRFFRSLVRDFRSAPAKDPETALKAALTAKTVYGDTHPVLTERMVALGVNPPKSDFEIEQLARELVEPPVPNAAEAYFGDRLESTVEVLDSKFGIGADEDAVRQMGELQERRRKVLEEADEHDPDWRIERARISVIEEDYQGALGWLEGAAALRPDDEDTKFRIALLKLELQREGALEAMEAYARDPRWAAEAYAAIAEHHERHGRSFEAREASIKMGEVVAADSGFWEELSDLTNRLDWYPANIEPSFVEGLSAKLCALPFVVAAYAIQRRHPVRSDIEGIVVLIVVDPPSFSTNAETGLQKRMEELENADLPDDHTLVAYPKKHPVAVRAGNHVPPIFSRAS